MYNEIVITVLAGILTAIAGYLGTLVKQALDNKEKRKIVADTVKYVEQVYKTVKGDAKLQEAKDKALEWMNTKGLRISEVELDILIHSFVNTFYGKATEQPTPPQPGEDN